MAHCGPGSRALVAAGSFTGASSPSTAHRLCWPQRMLQMQQVAPAGALYDTHSASGFWPKLRFSIVWALQAGHRPQSTAVATMADAARRKPSYLEYSMPRQRNRQVAHRLGACGCSSRICVVIDSEQARISAGLHPQCKVFEGPVACAADTAHPSDPLHGVCLV